MNTQSKTVLILVLGCAFFFWGCENKDSESTKTAQELAAVKAELAAAREQTAKLKTELAASQQEAAFLNSVITKIEAAHEDMESPPAKKSEISSEDIDKLRTEIKMLSQERDLLRRKVKTLTAQRNAPAAAPKTPSPLIIDSPLEQAKPPKSEIEPPQNTETAEKLQAAPSDSQSKDLQLAKKLQDAQSYVQSGNWQAAERLMMEIRAADPNYPGIDRLNSQIQNVKAQLTMPGALGRTH